MLTPQLLKDIEQHAIKEYPLECAGLIVDNKYLPMINTSNDPMNTFRISASDRLNAGTIEAVVHSHPYDKFNPPKYPPEWPSTPDMKGWMADNVPWIIVATDGEGISTPVIMDERTIHPLEGREFIHGVHDCYSVIRDWFRLERNTVLKQIPRGMEWWHEGENLYEDHFKEAGFRIINEEEAMVGDCVLMKIHSRVICHAAVITGHNTILHHVMHRLSGYDRLDKWRRQIVHYVRYEGTQ